MEISGRRKIYFILSALIVISASFALGAAFGYNQRPEIERVLGVINKSEPIPDTIDFAPNHLLPINLFGQTIFFPILEGMENSRRKIWSARRD